VIAVPEGLAGLIYRHSEGNPLFMVAVLEHMRERKLLTQENGNLTPTLWTPRALQEFLFSTAVSASAAKDGENFENLCEGLSRRQQIVRSTNLQEFPDGTVSARYEFVHALYREVMYNRHSPGRKAKLHLRVGEC
jgi:predicted ATPase